MSGGTAWPGERGRHGGADEIPLPVPDGALWLSGKHYVGPDPEAARRAVGADWIVCLCERAEIVDRYPGYVEWLENSPSAIWFPVPDLHAPDLPSLLALLDQLRAILAAGDGLLLHCGAGIGRAGTLAAALLMTLGLPRADAEAVVAGNRPLAGPEAGAQTELLHQLESELWPAG